MKRQLFILSVAVLLLTSLLVFPAMAQKQPSNLVREKMEVTYGGYVYKLDVVYPQKSGSFPGILVINGIHPDYLAQRGFLAVTGRIEDEKLAGKIIEKMKTLNKCNGKIGVVGHSFGGAMSMVIAATIRNVDAVVEMGGLLHPANNIDLSKDMPCPVMFISGEHDNLVSPEQTRQMYKQLKKGGKPAEVYIVPGQGHGFHGKQLQIVYEKTAAFFKKYLK